MRRGRAWAALILGGLLGAGCAKKVREAFRPACREARMAGSSRWRLCVLPFIVTMVLACGDSPSEPSYENIAGTYAGVLAGISQGIALAGTFSITMQQAGGDVRKLQHGWNAG